MSSIQKYFDLVASTLELSSLQKQVLVDIPFPFKLTHEEGSKNSFKKERKKKVKDANPHPKKLSGYIIFCNDIRDKRRDENGKLQDVKKCMSDAATSWKNLEDDEKTKWNRIADEKFNTERKIFLDKNPGWKPATKPTKIKIPRATSPWMVFLRDHMKKSSLKGTQCMEEASITWRGLSDDNKKSFVDLANASNAQIKEFKDFSKSIIDIQIADGIPSDKKSLRIDAAKRWSEKCLIPDNT